jgi:hypothetical protein
MGQEE